MPDDEMMIGSDDVETVNLGEGTSTEDTAEDTADDGTRSVPRDHSLACRSCGNAVEFNDVEEDGTVACDQCGTVNIPPAVEAPDES